MRAVQSNDGNAIVRLQRHSPESLSSGGIARLHVAQQVIARENGFRKWTDLKAHVDRIAVEQQATINGQPAALDGRDRTLHIRCGTDIIYDLALGGFSDDFLSFADPYVEGPVPRTQSLEEFVRIRADHLGQGDREAFDKFFSSYRNLERAREYSVVHIWMEHSGCTAEDFLGRLPNKHQGAVPGVAASRHNLRSTVPGGHVQIVALPGP